MTVGNSVHPNMVLGSKAVRLTEKFGSSGTFFITEKLYAKNGSFGFNFPFNIHLIAG